ncbi:MAG: hypothetical protein Q9M18_02675, partial [Mariprofundaceae bacterium]|nr:hypothetical protein [Mariprofundaceae bacterium]
MTEPSIQSPTNFPLDEQMEATHKPSKETVMVKQSKRWLWLLLGLLLGSVASLFTLPYLPQVIVNQLHLPTRMVMQPIAPARPTIAKKQVVVTPIVNQQALKELQTSIDTLQHHFSDFPQLKDDMQTLSHDVRALHQTQTDVRTAQKTIETMQLHSRLSWIVHSSSHLPQIRLAWEEIVLLPS